MSAACHFLTMIVNRSIDFTKSSLNVALVASLETVDVAECLKVPLQVIRLAHPNVALTMAAVPAHICQSVITDKHWLAENILCLLSNAVKYSDGGPISIDTSLRHDAETQRALLRFTVTDCGIGIPEAQRAALFQPFQQAQKMVGGTGLGLYSLQKRMEALSGFCGVASRADGAQGSSFWFEFLYRPDSSGAITDIVADAASVSHFHALPSVESGVCDAPRLHPHHPWAIRRPRHDSIGAITSNEPSHAALRILLGTNAPPAFRSPNSKFSLNCGIIQCVWYGISLHSQLKTRPSS